MVNTGTVKNYLILFSKLAIVIVVMSAASYSAKNYLEVSIYQIAFFGILGGSISLLILFMKTDTPLKRVGLLIWFVSVIIFGIFFLWREFVGHGTSNNNLIDYRVDEDIFVFSFCTMIVGILLRFSLIQAVIIAIAWFNTKLVNCLETGKAKLVNWIGTGQFKP